jgi:hypothetical protein
MDASGMKLVNYCDKKGSWPDFSLGWSNRRFNVAAPGLATTTATNFHKCFN